MNGMQENEWKAGKRRLGMNGMRANELNAGKQLEFLKDRIEKSHLTHLISLPSPLSPKKNFTPKKFTQIVRLSFVDLR